MLAKRIDVNGKRRDNRRRGVKPMEQLFRDPPGRSSKVRFRHVKAFGVPALLGLAVGCSPFGSSGCGEPPRATDASAGPVAIQDAAPPCTYSNQGVRGSKGHLVTTIDCPGTSDPFLVAVKVDGKPRALVETSCAGYGSQVQIDAGEWDSPDTLWHTAEVVVDPLNLFKETNEGNNRSVSQVRIVEPELSLNEYLTRVSDTNGNEVTTAVVGQPLWVIASARVGGWYQSAELSAKCTAFSFAKTMQIGSCDLLAYGPPLVSWDWTPAAAGDYSVEFRVKVLSGEADRDSANNVITRTLRVVPGP
jgi:hypothetical protein